MVYSVITRLKLSVLNESIDRSVTGGVIPIILIPQDKTDLIEYCKKKNCPHFIREGKSILTDILSLIKKVNLKLLTYIEEGDNISPAEIAFLAAIAESNNIDYTSNYLNTKTPLNKKIEVLSLKAWEWLDRKITIGRDDPTLFLREHIEEFIVDKMSVTEYNEPNLKKWIPPITVDK